MVVMEVYCRDEEQDEENVPAQWLGLVGFLVRVLEWI